MGDAVELARRNPETLIVVNHTGMPIERDEAGLALWRDGMKRLGAEPNVVAKISGLGMVDWRWSEASIRPFVLGRHRPVWCRPRHVRQQLSGRQAL